MLQTVWTKDAVREKLASDDWLKRAVIAIYKRQTDVERQARQTRELNGVGFTGVDANILSSFAVQLLRGRRLSDKQLVILRRKMPKYAGQLARIANHEI